MNATHSKRGNLHRLPAGQRAVQGWVRTALVVGVSVFGVALGNGALSAEVTGPGARWDAGAPTGGATTVSTAKDNLLEAARAEGGLSAFLALVEAAELDDLLESNGQLTVFAPHNSAFATEPLVGRRDRTDVRRLVLRHVVRGRHDLADLADRDHVNSITEYRSFTALSVERVGDRIVIGGEAWIVGETIQTENGVIHVISRVLT